AKTRAELTVENVATEIARLPMPLTEPRVETVLARHRERLDVRGASVLFLGGGGLLASDPPVPPRFRGALLDPAAADSARAAGAARFTTLAERPVRQGGATIGRVVIRRREPRNGWGYWETRTALLFVPIAVLAAAIAGLVIVRILVRRLRSIE